ncbi:MAG TPA: hypothetical protein VL979_02725 [Solirubrobacteraceae bacterium]|nr:hypothetical protein [Solirubrobacteraceae bacterium]
MQRFKRSCAKPRNRAGIATAVLLGIPVLLFNAATSKHYAPIAIDAAPALFLAFLLGRSVKVEPGHARSDEIGMLAYMPLAMCSFTFMLVPALYANVGKQPAHALDSFYTAAAGILAALLIALMIESHRLFHVDPQLQALRSWWIACVVVGILAALTGLTPDHHAIARETAYQLAWAGLAGAFAAGVLVMGRDYLTQLAEKTRYTPDATDEPAGQAEVSGAK